MNYMLFFKSRNDFRFAIAMCPVATIVLRMSILYSLLCHPQEDLNTGRVILNKTGDTAGA